MCGIFGYVGSRTAGPLLVEGLRTLEYRGYDSAGIFVPGYGAVKAVGPIDNLAAKITATIPGTSGIAHTRWATHGAPTEVNAHPHQAPQGTLWLVHNGIIENYRELRTSMETAGLQFVSDTDSEVLAALIARYYEQESSLVAAVQAALKDVRGTYGVAVMAVDTPDVIVVARLGSPIVIGIGVDGYYISSDPSALLTHTKDVVYLDDGEVAVLTAGSYEVQKADGTQQDKPAERIEWDVASVQKQGYEHYLLKEIMEIPAAIENTLRGRLIPDKGRVKLGGLELHVDRLAEIERITIVACGSAAYAGQVGAYLIEQYAGLPVEVVLASEYRYRHIIPNSKTAVIAITQSGETADTLAAVRKAKELGMMTLGVVNVVGSTIARETDAGVYNHAGPEVSIASTKAMVSQITVLIMMALYWGRQRGLSLTDGQAIVTALAELPAAIETVLQQSGAIKAVSERYAQYHDMMFIGRQAHAPIAHEAALKLKEVTYLHAEAYAGGELKHGPIAMLDESFPLVAFMPEDDVYEKMVSNVEEVKARGVPVIAVTTDGAPGIQAVADEVIVVPQVHPIVQPIVSVIPTYLFAYHVGVARGLNVDRPRNLAKSVTVE